MRGRRSEKKGSYLKIYRFLRSMMTGEDVEVLRIEYPGFRERSEDFTDKEILAGIECLVDAMTMVSPPDYENREPI